MKLLTVLLSTMIFSSVPSWSQQPPTRNESAAAVQPRVDLNTATSQELQSLPGVGKATADKIIAGRPYASADDLTKAGLPERTIEKIRPQVTVGQVRRGEVSTMRRSSPNTTLSSTATSASNTAPGPGMVWVNTKTKVFHREGDPYYGKTKHGKYMSESDAIKAGYRAAKNEGPERNTSKR